MNSFENPVRRFPKRRPRRETNRRRVRSLWIELLEDRRLLAVTAYTDQAAFLADLPGTPQSLNFDSAASGTAIADGGSLGGVAFNYDLGGVSLQVVDLPTTSPPHALGTDDGGVFQDGDSFQMTFAPTRAVGLFVISLDPLLNNDITLRVGGEAVGLDASDVQQILSDGSSVFFLGLIDDANSFTTASLVADSGEPSPVFLFNVDDIVTRAADWDTTCDGIDDDLDGQADEDFVSYSIATNLAVCVNGAVAMIPHGDWGDAPIASQSGFANDYPTRHASDGAAHFATGPKLGPARDVEHDGQPTAGADGDDLVGADEDGVNIPALVATETASIAIDLQDPHPSQNILNAWIDFNRDGDWDDDGEQIFVDVDLGTIPGLVSLQFHVPPVELGTTYARFRLSSSTGLLPTGIASDGEVEDYRVDIVAPILDDGNPCTFDVYVPGTGAVHHLVPDGTPADDGDPNTINDRCEAGVVVGDPAFFADTDIALSGSQLLITDVAGETSDTIAIQLDSTTTPNELVITNPSAVLGTSIPGASGHGTTSVRVPITGIASIHVNTAGGDDTLTIDFSGGNPIPAGGIQFDGGTGGFDSLQITGGTFHTSTFTYVNASDGSIALDVDGDGTMVSTISYTGLEPITSSIASDVVELIYTGDDETITVSDAGGGQTTVASTLGELTTFNNPTELLKIIATNGTDVVDVGALAAGYVSIEIAGDDATDVVNFNGAITFAADHGLTVSSVGTVNLPTAASDIAASGTGSVSLTALRNIALSSGSSITTVDGDLVLKANLGSTGTGNFAGVDLTDASLAVTGAGAIDLFGRGGNTGTDNYGVVLQEGAVVAGGGVGTTSVEGTGGASSGSDNHGVFVLDSSSRISSSGGNIEVVGTPGGGTGQFGIQIDADGQVLATTGTPSVTLIANTMNLASTSSVNAGANTVRLRQQTNSTGIALGQADSAATLGLIDAELDSVTAGTLVIGDSNTNGLQINTAITRPASTHVELASASWIAINPGSFNTGGGTLLLKPGGDVQPATSGVDLTASTVSFSAGADLAIYIGGPAVDTGYRQLNVAGQVDLAGVDLALSGPYVPAAADSFILVNNDGTDAIIGTFNGLPEGTTVSVNGVNKRITYVGGDGNDVELLESVPPTVTGTTPSFAASGSLAAGATTLQIAFSEAVVGGAAPGNFELRRAGVDGLLGTADDPLVAFSATYAANATTLTFTALPEDVYRLTVKDTITDTSSNALDGDGDNTAGGDWRRDFVVGALSTTLMSPAPNAYPFEVEFGGFGAGQLVQGPNEAFDGAGRLWVGSSAFSSAVQSTPAFAVTELESTSTIQTGNTWVAIPFNALTSSSGGGSVTGTGATVTLTLPEARTIRLSTEVVQYTQADALRHVRFLVNGVVTYQTNGGTAPVHYGSGWQSLTAEDYVTLPAGMHTIQVQTYVQDYGGLLYAAYSGADLRIAEVKGVPLPLSTDAEQTVSTSTQILASLEVHREVTVPNTGSENFARTVDTFHNPTGSPISTTVRIVGNLGSDAATTVFNTMNGDGSFDSIVDPTDRWIGTDDADGTGTPAIIHYLHGPNGLVPTNEQVVGDNIFWEYELTVPAGETVRLAHFTILNDTRAGAEVAAAALVTSNGFGGEAGVFLTSAEFDSLANFSFSSLDASLDGEGNLTISDSVGLDDSLTLRLDGPDLVIADAARRFHAAPDGWTLSPDGKSIWRPALGFAGSVAVNGNGGNDVLTIDFSGGDPVPAGGLLFDGGSQTGGNGDVLRILGTGVENPVYTPSGTAPGLDGKSGAIVIGGKTIHFDNLEPVDFDTIGDFTLLLPGTDDVVTLSQGFDAATGTLPAIVISGTSGGNPFESPHVRNGTITIDTTSDDGNDTIIISTVDGVAAGVTALTIDTGVGTDVIHINGIATFAGDVDLTSASITTAAALTSTGGTISFTADDQAIGAAVSAAASTVTLRTLTAGREIDLGTKAAGSLGLTDDELDRITAGTLRIGDAGSGPISVTSILSPANTGRLHLRSAGAVSVASGMGVFVAELAVSAGGAVTFGFNTSNDVDVFAAITTSGGISLRDADGLTIGTVDGVSGMTTPSGHLQMWTAGALTIDQPIDTDGGFFSLNVLADDALLTINAPLSATQSSAIIADKMDIQAAISVPGQQISLIPEDTADGNDAIHVGAVGDSTANTLELSHAELNRITAGYLRIGSNAYDTGPITIDGALAPTGISHDVDILNRGVGNNITLSPGASVTAPNYVGLYPTGASIVTDASGIDVIATNVVFSVGPNGNVGSPTAPLRLSVNNLWISSTSNSQIYLHEADSLNWTNSFNGSNSTVHLLGGTFSLGANNVIGDSNSIHVDGGTFNIGTRTDTVAGLKLSSGSITGTTGVLTSNSNFDLRSGSVSAILAGDVGIDKTTSGIVTLSKANTFSGVTTVSAGQLDITADGALGTTGGHTIVHAAGLLDFQLADYTTPEPIRMNGGALQNDFAGTNSFAGPVTLLATSLIDPGSSGSFALTGPIDGAGGFNKTGSATLILPTANSFEGTVTINQGVVRASDSLALGSTAAGTVVGAGTALELAGGLSVVGELLSLAAHGIGGTGALRATSGTNSWSGAITLNGSGGIGVDTSAELTLSGAMSGGELAKWGDGRLILTSANSYTGVTEVIDGILQIQNANALGTTAGGTTVHNGATLALQGGIVVTGESLSIYGPGHDGSGALQNVGGSNQWSGPITLGLASTICVDAPSLTLAGPINNNGFDLTFQQNSSSGGSISGVISGSGGFIKDGPGQSNLSGANTYTGLTTVNAGLLGIAGSGTLGSASSGTVVNIGATLGVFNTTPMAEPLSLASGGGYAGAYGALTGTNGATITGPVTLTGNATVSITNPGSVLTISGPIDDGGNGFGLTVHAFYDAGRTLVLSGANSYAGLTDVSSGRLIVDGSIGGDAVVRSGATLGGNGTVWGEVTANNGGRMAPGSSPGVLNTGNAEFSASSIFEVEINGPTPGAGGHDQLNVTGTVTIASGALLNAVLGYLPPVGTEFVLIDNDGSDPVVGAFSGLAEGTVFTLNNRDFQISYVGGDGNDVALTAVPTVVVWDGGGATNNWSEAANWVGDAVPQSGDDLVFPSTGTPANRFSPFNDFENFTVGKITIDDSDPTYSFALSGNALTLDRGVELTGGKVFFNLGFSEVRLGGDQAFLSPASFVSGDLYSFTTNSPIDTNGHRLTVTGRSYYSFGGVISGSGGLTFTQNNDSWLNAANTYTGSTEVISGNVGLQSNGTLGSTSGSTIITDGSLRLMNNVASDEPVTFLGNAGFLLGRNGALQSGSVTIAANSLQIASNNGTGTTFTVSGPITGAVGTDGLILAPNDASRTIVLSGANTYTGETKVSNSGTIQLGASGVIPDGSAVTVFGTTFLDLNGFNETIGSLAGTGNVALGTGTLTTGGNNLSTTFGGSITSSGGFTNVVKEGSGTFTLSGTNAYSGTTLINAGTLRVEGGGAIADNASVQTAGSGVFEVGVSETIGGLYGSAGSTHLTAGATLTVAPPAYTNSSYNGMIGGGGSLALAGGANSVWGLAGINTYDGTTDVLSGTLRVTGTIGTGGPAGTVTVASGAALGGSGTIHGTVLVNSGGSIRPGTSPGITHTGSVTFSDGSQFDVEIGGTALGTQYDQLSVTGTVTIGANVLLNLSALGGFVPGAGQVFEILRNDGSGPGDHGGMFQGLPEGCVIPNFLGSGLPAVISYTGGDGNDVVLTTILEWTADDDAYETDEDVVLVMPAPGIFVGDTAPPGQTLTAQLLSSVSHGYLSLNPNTGAFSYRPFDNFHGTDSFTYRVTNGSQHSAPATVTILVHSVNDPPVARNDAYATEYESVLTISAAGGLLANDTDVDSTMTAVKLTEPAHGTVTVNPDGSLTYTPAAGYAGPDSFTYQAHDGQADSNVATVSITVNPPGGAAPAVETVQINDGSAQRSMVNSVAVTFTSIVNLPAGAFHLVNKATNEPVGLNVSQSNVTGKTVSTLTFDYDLDNDVDGNDQNQFMGRYRKRLAWTG